MKKLVCDLFFGSFARFDRAQLLQSCGGFVGKVYLLYFFCMKWISKADFPLQEPLRTILQKKRNCSPGNSLWPFSDGEKVTLSKVVGDL